MFEIFQTAKSDAFRVVIMKILLQFLFGIARNVEMIGFHHDFVGVNKQTVFLADEATFPFAVMVLRFGDFRKCGEN